MRNMRVSHKLALCFAIIAVFAGIVGLGGTYGIFDIAKMNKQMYNEHQLATEAMGDIREAFQQERNYLKDMLIYIDDPEMINICLKNIDATNQRGEAAIQKYTAAVTDMSLEGPMIEVSELTSGPYLQAKELITASAKAGDAQGLLRGLEESVKYVSIIESNLAISTSNHVTRAADQAKASESLSGKLAIVNISIVVLTCFVAIFLGFYLSGQISKPLALMAGFFQHAGATGDISISPETLGHMQKISNSKDEIGEISFALAGFMERITAVSKSLQTVAGGRLLCVP